MSSAQNLIGVGMPGEQARRIGLTFRTIAGVGTAQSGAASISVNAALLTTAVGQTAFVFASTASPGAIIRVYNTSATAALIFPQVGGAIDGGSTDASVSLAQNKGREFVKVSATDWRSIAGA